MSHTFGNPDNRCSRWRFTSGVIRTAVVTGLYYTSLGNPDNRYCRWRFTSG